MEFGQFRTASYQVLQEHRIHALDLLEGGQGTEVIVQAEPRKVDGLGAGKVLRQNVGRVIFKMIFYYLVPKSALISE